MNNSASILVLLFLAITFVMSIHEKIFSWKETISWLNQHFSKTIIKNFVSQSLILLVFMEFVSCVLCAVGIIQLLFYSTTYIGYYGAVFSCLSLLIMLIGQRLAKDYDGARTIVIYFIPALIGVFLLS